MAKTLTKTLSKKGALTGQEVAFNVIANWLSYCIASLEGKPNYRPLFTDAEINAQVRSLKTDADKAIYNNLISIKNWLAKILMLVNGNEQACMLGYTRIYNRVTNILATEDLFDYMRRLPVIMTEEQYKRAHEEAEKAFMEEAEDEGFSLLALIREALNYYTDLLRENPKAANPLKALKSKLEKEPVTDAAMLRKWRELNGEVVYCLPDGRTKEEAGEEWSKVIGPELYKIEHDKKLTEEEREAAAEEYFEAQALRKEAYIFKGMSEEEAEEAVLPKVIPTRKIIMSTLTPSKWEFLTQDDNNELAEYFRSLDGEAAEGLTDDETMKADAEAFRKEFPEVVKVLLADIAKKYFPELKDYEKRNGEEWADYVRTFKELYELDYYDFKNTRPGKFQELGFQAFAFGVAIVRPEQKHRGAPRGCLSIDANGNYKAPAIPSTVQSLSLEALFTDAEGYAEASEELLAERRETLRALYFCKGYNTILDLLGEVYGIPNLLAIRARTAFLEERIKIINETFLIAFKKIRTIEYKDKELQAKKLETMRAFFYPLPWENAHASEEAKEAARAVIRENKYNFARAMDPLADLLLDCFENLDTEKGEA